MKSFAERLTEDRRLVLLRILLEQNARRAPAPTAIDRRGDRREPQRGQRPGGLKLEAPASQSCTEQCQQHGVYRSVHRTIARVAV